MSVSRWIADPYDMRTRGKINRDDSGFTLIEVLSVAAIISVLSSIAIPLLHGQVTKAQSASGASDLRNTATSMESYFTDSGVYGSATEITANGDAPDLSQGSTILIVQHSGTSYCLAALRRAPVPGSFAELQTSAVGWYDSAAGGLQPSGATGCSVPTAVASDWD